MVRSSNTGVGNTKKDQAYIEWMELEGKGLEVIDPQEEGLPFAAKLMYAGDGDSDDSPWKIPPPGKRCNGRAYVRDEDGDYIVDKNRNRIMRPCWNWPIRGGKVCLFHGGGVVRVRKAAIERMASALDAASGALIKIALNENEESKVRVQAINSIMDRVGVRGGVEVDLKDPGYLDVLKGFFERSGQKHDD